MSWSTYPQYGVNAVACHFCQSRNAQFHEEWCVVTLIAAQKKKIEELERKLMSAAMWCDPGHHAFSANEDGIETLTRVKVIKTDSYGGKQDVAIQIHICAEHMKKFDPFGEHTEADNVKRLEAWNDGWNAAKAGEEVIPDES